LQQRSLERRTRGARPRTAAKRPTALRVETLEDRRMLTIVISGNGNTDAASLLSAGGPGNTSSPGWVNVGKGSTNNSSVTYLGGGWVITAAHVTIDNNVGPIRFGNDTYQADMSSIVTLKNNDNTPTDLKLFRLTTDPGLPEILPSQIVTAVASGRQIMIGNGLNQTAQQYWDVDSSGQTWVWQTQSPPANPGPNDYSGFTVGGSRVIRWGENNVHSIGLTLDYQNGTFVRAYSTRFDEADYTGQVPLASEGQGSVGDSGGAVFTFSGGQWKLAGIMITVGPYNNQPASTAVFGNLTYIADLSYYRDAILKVTSSVLARRLFYEGSTRYDTTGAPQAPLPVASDNAIATDKTAYLPGTGAATFANVSSYTRGINGIMIDIAGSRPDITAADFVFKVGNNNTPSGWTAAPAPLNVTVRPNAGVSGSDRIEITWADGAIQNSWLQVTLAANANTGLAAADTFFFGNAIGDTGLGNTSTQATVNATDEVAVRNNPASVFNNIPITNIHDFNRDGAVNTTDALVARNYVTSIGNVVRFLNLSNPPSAPEAEPATDVPIRIETDSAQLEAERSGTVAALLGPLPNEKSAGQTLPPAARGAIDEWLLDVLARGRRLTRPR